MYQPYLTGVALGHGNARGCVPWALQVGNLFGARPGSCLTLSPGLLFVESRAQEKAGACTGFTLIESQELGSALGSVAKLWLKGTWQYILLSGQDKNKFLGCQRTQTAVIGSAWHWSASPLR